eukprot:1369184-Prymnesium_polylepis.2
MRATPSSPPLVSTHARATEAHTTRPREKAVSRSCGSSKSRSLPKTVLRTPGLSSRQQWRMNMTKRMGDVIFSTQIHLASRPVLENKSSQCSDSPCESTKR